MSVGYVAQLRELLVSPEALALSRRVFALTTIGFAFLVAASTVGIVSRAAPVADVRPPDGQAQLAGDSPSPLIVELARPFATVLSSQSAQSTIVAYTIKNVSGKSVRVALAPLPCGCQSATINYGLQTSVPYDYLELPAGQSARVSVVTAVPPGPGITSNQISIAWQCDGLPSSPSEIRCPPYSIRSLPHLRLDPASISLYAPAESPVALTTTLRIRSTHPPGRYDIQLVPDTGAVSATLRNMEISERDDSFALATTWTFDLTFRHPSPGRQLPRRGEIAVRRSDGEAASIPYTISPKDKLVLGSSSVLVFAAIPDAAYHVILRSPVARAFRIDRVEASSPAIHASHSTRAAPTHTLAIRRVAPIGIGQRIDIYADGDATPYVVTVSDTEDGAK